MNNNKKQQLTTQLTTTTINNTTNNNKMNNTTNNNKMNNTTTTKKTTTKMNGETHIYKVYPKGYKENNGRYDRIATKREQARWNARDWKKVNARIAQVWGNEASDYNFVFEKIGQGINI